MNNMEIEKKYLINRLPDKLDDYVHHHIEQGYVCTHPVIRIRKKLTYKSGSLIGQKLILTIKGDGMLSRREFELEIDDSSFDCLSQKVSGNIISKNRYEIPLENNLMLELDIFDGLFKGLIIGEIEFPDEEMAKKYNPPDYIGREVTFDERFHNSILSSMSESDISDLLTLMNNCN
ncbi:MAG: CYTH domain-containing protein [Lachnospiraceae bacterium]|nr:CYTH domain-containing protein [Lachnospiraceae bacterium]